VARYFNHNMVIFKPTVPVDFKSDAIGVLLLVTW